MPSIKEYAQSQDQEITGSGAEAAGRDRRVLGVTTHITLPGRMIVLMPTVDHVGVSGRISEESERARLKETD